MATRTGAVQATIEAQIYPQASTGFSDSNAYLRELTLKSMLVLAPKLTQKTLNQSLLKHLAKLQVGSADLLLSPQARPTFRSADQRFDIGRGG